jgi:DNA-binding transcriptional regulator GbsR (MarR family)
LKSTVNQKGGKVETYDFGSDFKILTPKEKREILKNAKNLLKLQMENNVLPAGAHVRQKEKQAMVKDIGTAKQHGI